MAKKKAAVTKSVEAPKKKATTPAATKPVAARPRSGKTTEAQPAVPMACNTIGECAGVVWSCLNDQGPQSLAKLKKSVDAPADMVLAAIGWLAREGKLTFETGGKQVTLSLR